MLNVNVPAVEPDDRRSTSLETIRRVLLDEAAAVQNFAGTIDGCVDAADLIFHSAGTLIVSGMGKSGHIAQKVAATFRSLGKPAIFLHPAEASHGDLGLILNDSVVLAISNSGETSEFSDLLHFCNFKKIPIIAITGKKDSTLARASEVAIVYGIVDEACHNGLAPTTSTTLSLAIGDALAVSVSEMLGTLPADFHFFHPGGKLGARLTKVRDIMRTGKQLPVVEYTADMSEVVVTISEKAVGAAVIVRNGNVEGIITDGDLRRNIDQLWNTKPNKIATSSPVWVRDDCLVSEAADLMSEKGISLCLVGDNNKDLRGVIHIHDCIRSGAT